MVSTPEVFRRQKEAQKAANKLYKKVEQRSAESDKANSHLPIVTRAIVRVYNGLLLWLCEEYPDEILWLYQHGSNPCLQHVWMFDKDVNTAIALLKDKNKTALATDIEERWQNISQKAKKTDKALRKLRDHYDRDEDNPAYANDVKEALFEIKTDVNQLAENLFEVAKQQASEAKTELKRKGNGRGRPKKHSENTIKAAQQLFDELQGEGKSVNECWFEVCRKLGFVSPLAAKQAVYRYKKQNKKQN